MIITEKCPHCSKVKREKSSSIVGQYKITKLECGHSLCEIFVEVKEEKIISLDNKELYPFQYEGVKKAEKNNLRFLFADEMGLGKANPNTSRILTPNGYVPMGKLKIGDEVLGEDGQPHNVIGVFPQGVKQVYKLTFSDGSYAHSCDEHIWPINTPMRKFRNKSYINAPLKDFKNDLHSTSFNSSGKKNSKWYIPITAPVNFKYQYVNIDPYCLGLLIGDGCFTSEYRVGYSSQDHELVSHLENGLEAQGCFIVQKQNSYDYRINNNYNLINQLKSLELFGHSAKTKFVPHQYKINTKEIRLSILRGLMDTDGSIWNNGVIEFTTISKQLAEDVRFLVQSLGGVVKTSVKTEPKYTYKGEVLTGASCYRLVININICPFRLARKAELFNARGKKYYPSRAIINVEKSHEEECTCIAVDNPSHLYLMEEFIVTHNTPQVLGVIKRHSESLPVIFLVKSGLKYQWMREIIRWLGKDKLVQIVHNGRTKIQDGFDCYIISLDLLKSLDLEEVQKQTGAQTIVIDECQLIKNRDSQRTQAVQRLCSGKISRKREFVDDLGKASKVKVIAEDLLTYHGLNKRFKLLFDKSLPVIFLGLCEVKKFDDGLSQGRIAISYSHAISDSVDEVIETILHEIAHALTPGAGHSRKWSDCAKSIGSNGEAKAWCNGSIEVKETLEHAKYLLAASGTPIKNHAAEFFPILNLLDPAKFYSYDHFERYYVDMGSYGVKPGGIKPFMLESFKKETENLLIRRERTEVMKDLPPINRTFFYTEMGETVERMYNEQMKKFLNAHDEMEEEGGWGNNALRTNVLSYITKMRHICGLAQITPCVEWVKDFLNETDRKLCIFVHHKDVGELLFRHINQLCEEEGIDDPIRFTSEMDNESRDKALEMFIKGPSRIAILSTLSSGEGLDGLQKVCSDMILLERQWNPANEEQVEGRFSRIGVNESVQQVNSTYFLALGTIVEWFADLVENKRKIVKQTLTGENLSYSEESLLRELVDITAAKGRKILKPTERMAKK